MSSLKFKGMARLALVAGLSLGLSACFRPLYGPTASGQQLQDVLASIEVRDRDWPQQQAAIGHYLRSELVYALNGSGVEVPKRYVLDLSLNQRLTSPIVDSRSGRALAATFTGDLTYTLKAREGGAVIATGVATASASYDRFQQRFATVRAGRDAEIRVAKSLADQVKTRLSAALTRL